MADSTQKWYDKLVDYKKTFTSLNGLTPISDSNKQLLADLSSPSKVAQWRLLLWNVAEGIHDIDLEVELFIEDIKKVADTLLPGTEAWLRDEAMKFQYGDSLAYIDEKYQYSLVDVDKQIIKMCAIEQIGSNTIVKVAKLDSGDIVPLTAAEKTAFITYLNQIKYAGTRTIARSDSPDLLHINIDIYYDPQLLNADGALIGSVSVPVEDTISNYIKSMPFNGVLNITKLNDAIQGTTGVADVKINYAKGKRDGDVYANIDLNYNTYAGYMKVDPANDLSSNITYIAI